nr:MAG TPA: hypothetical protein [Caudoviricetes sp.]
MVDLTKVLQPPKEQEPFPRRYSVRYETYAVAERFGLLTCLIRDDKEGRFVGAGVVKYEQSAPYGHTSRGALRYVCVDAIGAVRPGCAVFKTWEELKKVAHSMAVDDAMRNGHHLVLVEGGDF